MSLDEKRGILPSPLEGGVNRRLMGNVWITDELSPRANTQPKKKFGQNFLVNRQMQKKVVDRMRLLVENYPDREILEIGPGQGDLTQHFVDFGKPVTAIEIDPEAVQELKQRFANRDNLEIVEGDALELVGTKIPLLRGGQTAGLDGVDPWQVKTKDKTELNYPWKTKSLFPYWTLPRNESPQRANPCPNQTPNSHWTRNSVLRPSAASGEVFDTNKNLETNAKKAIDFVAESFQSEVKKRVEYLSEKNSDLQHSSVTQSHPVRPTACHPSRGKLLNRQPSKDWLVNGNFILLANLPFNVGSRILVDLPIYSPNMPFAVILQKEVAQKVRRDKDFTFFGAWLNLFWDLKVEFDIAPGNFYPSPKIYSSLLVGVPKTKDNRHNYPPAPLSGGVDPRNPCQGELGFVESQSSSSLSLGERVRGEGSGERAIVQGNAGGEGSWNQEKQPPSPRFGGALPPEGDNLLLNSPQDRIQTRTLLQTLFHKPRKTIQNNLKGTEFEQLCDKVEPNERLGWGNYEELLKILCRD